jgi:hypothetical protein
MNSMLESTIENGATCEQFCIRKTDKNILIGRCSSKLEANDWIQKIGKKAEEIRWQLTCIQVQEPKIGSVNFDKIYLNDLTTPNLRVFEEGEDQQQQNVVQHQQPAEAEPKQEEEEAEGILSKE